MSEVDFMLQKAALSSHGVISNSDERESFWSNLCEIYDMVSTYDMDYWGVDADPDDLYQNYSPLTKDILNAIKIGTQVDGEMVSSEIDFMIDILEGGDMNDSFGTEGWRHRLGWDH